MTARALLPPPLAFGGAVVALFILAVLVPGPRLLEGAWRAVGLLPAAGGATLHWWAWRLFYRRGTSVRADEPPRTLVTSGPYRYTRNPMYLGGVLILLGAWLLIGTATPALAAVAYAVVADQSFIAAEETAMAERFGEPYRAYRDRVRRWI